ncbi:hypothetical protein [Rhizobium lusitanum]|uniref:DUF2147 domain-containing protein n=1 Tax=Rhizobium lusitanum TaxID=293958 RepID=A0A7X0MFR3_9HYPH|nr:hypothetical protein [Rhizobium lusitanum]MBB6489292.1 hypothetical protein [Rhizobium lusitanum]
MNLQRFLPPLARRALAIPAIATLVLAAVPIALASATEPKRDDIVGTWVVVAPDAPFTHHMFVFNADGTMQQANPDAGNPDNSDSDGKGIWIRKHDKILGKFVEVTADRKTAKFVSRGEVSYEVEVSGNTLKGTASAKFFGPDEQLLRGPLSTPLEGKRVTLP